VRNIKTIIFTKLLKNTDDRTMQLPTATLPNPRRNINTKRLNDKNQTHKEQLKLKNLTDFQFEALGTFIYKQLGVRST
jgi:hypothetical protein